MKRPSFQFYPGDWLHDAALRMVSIGARGLWIDMMCLMHQGSEYGKLKVNDKVILPANLARMVGATLPDIDDWLTELRDAGVFSVDDDGCIYSRRMIRDEEIRKSRAEGGKKGGNPMLLAKSKGVSEVNLSPNLVPTPSSSSSSSSREEGTCALKPSRASRGTRFALASLPDDWREFCQRERPELDPDRVFERFVDYWVAQPGKDGRKVDWLATWRNWIRRESTHARRNDSHPQDSTPKLSTGDWY